jgi:hypothetical protein
MLGNWSFGDYFKEGAIRYAWELLTSPEADGGLGFDPKDLWVTVYEEDDEAHDLWREIAALPEERIQRLGKDTNYWSTGLPGPAARARRSSSTAAPRTASTGDRRPTTTATSRSGTSCSCSTRSPMCEQVRLHDRR